MSKSIKEQIQEELKDAIYQPNAALRVDDIQGIYGEGYKSLTREEKQLVQELSLRQLINKIRQNPQVYGRLVFKIIVNSANASATDSQTISELGFSNQDISKLWSIYKGFFEINNNNKGSLAFIQQQYGHKQNYYAAVCDACRLVNALCHHIGEDFVYAQNHSFPKFSRGLAALRLKFALR